MSGSLVIKLRPDLSRDEARNDSTLCLEWSWAPRAGPEHDFGGLFVRHYDEIRSSLETLSGPGLVAVVIGPSGFEGSAALAAKADSINALTIGRHGSAELYLSQDRSLSLRQGAILLYPLVIGQGVRFRVLDLRSARPFEDARGRPFEALEADGPVFLRAGAYALFLFPREADSPPWSGSPEDVWAAMPEVAYLEEAGLAREPAAGAAVDPWAGLDSEATLVLKLPGPRFEPDGLLGGDEEPHGQLVVRSGEGEMKLVLGRTAVRHGVLLGRYERCDGSRRRVLAHFGISRVHALVIEIAGKVYAVDAGSRNGLWLRSERVRLAPLGPGQTVALANLATMEWAFTH